MDGFKSLAMRDMIKEKQDDAPDGRSAAADGRSASLPRYAVEALLRGGREAILEHNGAEYHLRITANGRLILTK